MSNDHICLINCLCFEKRKNNNPLKTGDIWGHSSLDEDHTLVNHHIKYLKKGYGLVTDQVCEGIHQGLITREKGIKLLEKYDGKVSQFYIDKFCKYLEISTKTYNEEQNVSLEEYVSRALVNQDKIYYLMNSGVFKADIQSNLKLPSSWSFCENSTNTIGATVLDIVYIFII